MPLPAGLRALEHQAYRRFFIGQVISQSGSWMQAVGQSWLVLQLTDSALKVSLIPALQFLPMLLGSLVAGALTDRLSRRRVVLVTQSAQALLAVLLAALAWSGLVQYWHVAVLALLFGCTATLDTPARQSLLIDIVGREDLPSAQALSAMTVNTARLLGPAAGGLLIAAYGVPVSFFINSLSFLPVIWALLTLRTGERAGSSPRRALLREVGEGIHFSRGHEAIRTTLLAVMTMTIWTGSYGVLLPLLAKQELHLDADGLGLLMSAQGIGSVAGATALAAWGARRPTVQGLLLAAGCLAVTTATLGLASGVYPVAALLVVAGFLQPVFFAGSNTMLQVEAPDTLRGRVMSLFPLAAAGMTPVSSAVAGLISERWGISAGFGVGGVVAFVSVVGLYLWGRFRSWRHLSPAEAEKPEVRP